MLEFINEFRNAPERTYAVLGVKAFGRLTNCYGGKSRVKTALMDLKSAKNGSFVCEKEICVRLCDLCALAVSVGLIMTAVAWIKGRKCGDE